MDNLEKLKEEMLVSNKWVYTTFKKNSYYGKLELIIEELWEKITIINCNYPFNIKLEGIYRNRQTLTSAIKEAIIDNIILLALKDEPFTFYVPKTGFESEDEDDMIIVLEKIEFIPNLTFSQFTPFIFETHS